MTTLLTGATGYLGGYLVDRLLARGEPVTALVRADDAAHGRGRLWEALQLHQDPTAFQEHLERGRLRFVVGDVRLPRLGLEPRAFEALVAEHDGLVHAAATLNRRSERACQDVNLRGGLTIVQLARRMHDRGGLRRYLHVSTVAVAGKRRAELVAEDAAIEWERSDWDPYARTKKFGEHLVQELLPDASVVVVRPSIVLGDSRFPQTTQFDMVRAFVHLARLPLLPFDPAVRLDIVNADFVADAAAALHLAPAPRHRTYHLSAGAASPTYREVVEALVRAGQARPPRFLPSLGGAAGSAIRGLSAAGPLRKLATLLEVFWPYLEWDVVFDNTRVQAETGLAPVPFPRYCAGLFDFAAIGGFTYPFLELPRALADAGELGAWRPAGAAAPAGGGGAVEASS